MITRRVLVALLAAPAVLLASCSSAATSGPSTTPTASPAATLTPPPASAPTPSASIRPVVATTPCTGNTARKAVLVRLKVQHLWLCERGRSVRDSPITSGIPGEYTSTPTGRYEIQALTRDTSLTLISGQTYAVKYWIPFDGPLFGFHDSSWQEIPYGSQQYRQDGSHGCVHLPLKTIRYLYRWADVGTKVRIRA